MKDYYIFFKKSRWFPLVTGLFAVIIGVLGLIRPQVKMESVALFAGILFLIYGLLAMLNGILIKDSAKLRFLHIVLGVVVIVLAILDFANLGLIGKYLPTLVGFFMIIAAVANLVPSLVLLKNGLKSWWYGAFPSVILLVLGFIFLLCPGFVGASFGIFSGVSLLIMGISQLISFVQYKE